MPVQEERVDLCVVLPVCDEEACIVAVVAELCETLLALPNLARVALLIVDDCSQDNGIALLKDWFRSQQLPGVSLTVLSLQQRHGMSMALLKGFKLAVRWSPRLTLVMDADGQDDPQFIAALVAGAERAEVVFALRGKRSETWLFRACYALFQLLMWLGSGSRARANQFCVMRTSVLTQVAFANYIDYLGAMLSASSFSRTTLIAPRRPRHGGQSKFNWRGHMLTAFTIMSWQPRLLARLQRLTLLLLLTLGIVAVSTANLLPTTLLVCTALVAHLCWTQMNTVLLRRANSQPFVLAEQAETITTEQEWHASG